MRTFMLKNFQWLNIISFLITIVSFVLMRGEFEWKNDPPEIAIMLYVFGMVIWLVSWMTIIPLKKITIEEDKIQEMHFQLDLRDKELDKLINFTKDKVFKSTIMNRKEVCEHMGWEYKEEKK